MDAIRLVGEVASKQTSKVANRVSYGTRYLATMNDCGDIVSISTKKIEKQCFWTRVKKSLGIGKKSKLNPTQVKDSVSVHTDLYATFMKKENALNELCESRKLAKGKLSDIEAKMEAEAREYESGALDKAIKEMQEKIKKEDLHIREQRPRKAEYPYGMENDPIRTGKPAETAEQFKNRIAQMRKERLAPLEEELARLVEQKESFLDRRIAIVEERDKILASIKEIEGEISAAKQEYRAFRDAIPEELHLNVMKNDNDIERFWR